MLNHLLWNPLTYFHDVKQSPLYHMLTEAGHKDINSTFVYFTDSSFQDSDDMRSTGCYLGFLQGGLIDMSSAVPSKLYHILQLKLKRHMRVQLLLQLFRRAVR
jgi:hypothetical protein